MINSPRHMNYMSQRSEMATDDNLTQKSGNQSGASLFKILCNILKIEGTYKQKKDRIVERIEELIKFEANNPADFKKKKLEVQVSE